MMRLVQDNVMPHLMRTFEDMLNINLYLDGYSNIFDLPEYSDISRARMFLNMLNQKDVMTDELIRRGEGLKITIGDENDSADMKDCSLITATYHIDGKLVGKIGVIGPTRMKYGKITSVIEYLTDNLNNAFTLPGGQNDKEKER